MKTLLILIYLITSVLSAGAINSCFKIDQNGNKITRASKEGARLACGSNFLIGIAGPISLVYAAFITGFFAYGFDWSCDNYSETMK